MTALAEASASFPPAPVSARDARRFLRAFLDEHDRDDLTDAAELALSEAVTNAVLHAHTDFDVALLLIADGGLRVEVADRNPQLPVQRDYAAHAATGRGMELIAAMTADCGVYARGAAGKTVWFVVRNDDPQHHDGPVASDLLAAWDIDPDEAAGSAAGPATVILMGLPPALWLAAREHHDAMMRELALYAAEHPADAPPPEGLALADQARAWISTHVVAALDRLATTRHAPRQAGYPRPPDDVPAHLDLLIAVPDDAAAAFAALQDVLGTVERLAAAGTLLSDPGPPDIVAVRDWAASQAIAQLAGAAPSPWPAAARPPSRTGPP